MSKCPHCGASFQETLKYCRDCGQLIPSSPPGDSSSPVRDAIANPPTEPLSEPPSVASPVRDEIANVPTQNLAQMEAAVASEVDLVGPTRPTVSPQDEANRDELARCPTSALPEAVSGFAPLPQGALVPKERPDYEVIEIRSQGQKLNVYLVESVRPTRLCLNSDCLLTETDDMYCPDCGGQTSEPALLHYLLKESSEAATFASVTQIRKMNLNHPGLLLFQQFQETPYGNSPRFYLLEPEPGPPLADSLTVPQELPRVLDWGRQLAEALDYLHQHRLVWRTLTGRHIAIEAKRARWVNFNTGNAQAAADYQRDVQALANVLFYLATGSQTYIANPQLPEPAVHLFEQVLGPHPTVTTATELANSLENVLAEVRHPASVRFISDGQTDTGIVRDHNEDSLMTQELAWSNEGLSRPLGIYVVADGMGGHSAGEVASGMVISTLVQKMTTEIMATQAGAAKVEAIEPVDWLKNSIAAANAAVFEQAKKTGTDMGTTVVAALLFGDMAYVGHVGDSRAYLLNNERLRQVTVDHSLVERLIATNQISRAEAQHHPQRNVIYRTIGDKPRVEVEVTSERLNPGDRLLLCSDGLNGMVADDDIWQIVIDSPSLPEACRRLINAANAAGGDDNVTVIIVQVEPA